MVLDVNMLRPRVEFWIVRERNCTLVILMDNIAVFGIVAEFSQNALDPNGLLYRLRECDILRFGSG